MFILTDDDDVKERIVPFAHTPSLNLLPHSENDFVVVVVVVSVCFKHPRHQTSA